MIRRQQLHRVVGMSCYLIRPQVNCRNLASQVLGLALRRLVPDFERGYGYQPLLAESFVDIEAFAGTCYQAANWVKIGQTQGRGRQDRQWVCPTTVKGVYVYPLRPDFCARLGVPEPQARPALAITEGLDGAEWADNEFGGARLGDRRLGERLVASARILAEQPGQPFSGVAKDDWPAVKGYYRMIDHADDSAVTMAAISARLGDAVRVVAKLGGHLDRDSDPPPGHQLMWRGFAGLQMMCLGYTLRDHLDLLEDVSG